MAEQNLLLSDNPRNRRKSHPKSTGRERKEVLRQLSDLWQKQVEQADTETLRHTLHHWQPPIPPPVATSQEATKASLVLALAGGRTFRPEETLLLELEAQQRAFAHRHALLQGSLSASQVAALLRTGRQTPHDRLHSQTLLAVEDQGRWKFPYWQFDPNGPQGVVAGLPEVLKALSLSPLGKVSWLTSPNSFLEGRTPLQALKEDDKERVVDQALCVGVV